MEQRRAEQSARRLCFPKVKPARSFSIQAGFSITPQGATRPGLILILFNGLNENLIGFGNFADGLVDGFF